MTAKDGRAAIIERPETGWATARRLRKGADCTCAQAMAAMNPRRGRESAVVKGEN